MLYLFLRFWLGLTLRGWFRKVHYHFEEVIPKDRPVIFACNHPNSAIDFVQVAFMFNRPIYVLVRGDVFEKKSLNRLFRAIWMLPVYRIRDGYKNLSRNEESFKECFDLFNRNGHVHIFSEGICIQEKNLQPLKKGTARLALDYWKANRKDIAVVPVGVNYTRFRSWRSSVMVRFGQIKWASDYAELLSVNPASAYNQMTIDLENELKNQVIELSDFEDDNWKEKLMMLGRMNRSMNLNAPFISETIGEFDEERRWSNALNEMDSAKGEQLIKHISPLVNHQLDGFLSLKWKPWQKRLIYRATLPLMMLLALPVYMPWRVSKWIIQNKIKDKIFHDSVMVFGCMILYMLQALIITAISMLALGFIGIWIPVLIIMSSIVGIALIDPFLVLRHNQSFIGKEDELEALHKDLMKAFSLSRDSVKAA